MDLGMTCLCRLQQTSLNSVVLGVEEWLHGHIRQWNTTRLIDYCHEVIAVVDDKKEDLENRVFSRRKKTMPAVPHDRDSGSSSKDDSLSQGTSSFTEITCKRDALEGEGEGAMESDTLCTVLEDAPPLPADSDCFSASTVKASAAISGIQKSHLLDVPWPFYLINTRDCFKYDLIEVKIKVRIIVAIIFR